MRTTVTLDPDTRLLVENLMRDRGITFKEAVNEAIRMALRPRDDVGPFTIPRALGRPLVDLTKANQLAGELEDEALVRKMLDGR